MRLFHSIRWRLLGWYGILLAVLLGILDFSAYQAEKNRVLKRLDSDLQQRINIVAQSTRPDLPGARERNPNPHKSVSLTAEDLALFNPNQGYYYVVWLRNGDPLTESASAPANVPRPAEGTGERTRGNYRESYLNPRPGDCILVGRSTDADNADLLEFVYLTAGMSLLLLILGLLGGWWLSARALRPIMDITTAASKIADGDLAQRIDTLETESELGELASVLNQTFARLEANFAQQARFTADAAHELRTPVTVILMHAQNGLAADGLTEEHREAFEACQRAAQRMRRLIESLLQLARFDSGLEPLKNRPYDLAAITEECIDLIRPLAFAKNITLVPQLEPAAFHGDADRIGQVITNLLTNAIHYNTPDGAVRVVTASEGGIVRCEVIDNGIGLSPDHLPHIFDRFYRVDKARTTQAGRTGLGLAISKTIVEAAGGTLEVQSVFGEGSTFTVRLPVGE